jgi:hypothetical protein
VRVLVHGLDRTADVEILDEFWSLGEPDRQAAAENADFFAEQRNLTIDLAALDLHLGTEITVVVTAELPGLAPITTQSRYVLVD